MSENCTHPYTCTASPLHPPHLSQPRVLQASPRSGGSSPVGGGGALLLRVPVLLPTPQ